ncbi:MAG TPA: hypothetical protein VIJ95_15910 [Hanamia sp.]
MASSDLFGQRPNGGIYWRIDSFGKIKMEHLHWLRVMASLVSVSPAKAGKLRILL